MRDGDGQGCCSAQPVSGHAKILLRLSLRVVYFEWSMFEGMREFRPYQYDGIRVGCIIYPGVTYALPSCLLDLQDAAGIEASLGGGSVLGSICRHARDMAGTNIRSDHM